MEQLDWIQSDERKKLKVKKYLNISSIYVIDAMSSGAFYCEFTKWLVSLKKDSRDWMMYFRFHKQ